MRRPLALRRRTLLRHSADMAYDALIRYDDATQRSNKAHLSSVLDWAFSLTQRFN